jgi:hypothetical protein
MPKKKQVVEPVSEVIEPTVVETTIDETVLDVSVPPDSTHHEAPAPAPVTDLSTLPPDEVKEVKVKAKRKAQPKKIEVKEITEVKAPINIPEEPKEITEELKKKVKTLEQVQCDTCEKEMTKRTLRYHHKCPGEVVKREELPVKKRVKKETKKEDEKQEATTSVDERTRGPQSIPEKPVLMNTYQERLQKALERRSQTIQKLASQIV